MVRYDCFSFIQDGNAVVIELVLNHTDQKEKEETAEKKATDGISQGDIDALLAHEKLVDPSAQGSGNIEEKAEEIMSSPLITIEVNAAIGEAAKLMSDKKIRRLLVTEKGSIVGIITEKDVLRGTLSYFENVLLTI